MGANSVESPASSSLLENDHSLQNLVSSSPARFSADRPPPAGAQTETQMLETEMLKTERLSEAAEAGPHRGSQTQMEKLIGVTLLAGVLASTCVVFLGGVIYVWRHSAEIVDYRVFRGESSDLRSLRGVGKEVKALAGRGIIQFGLILLVGLQVLRVALTGAFFLESRDRVFVAITTIVLALLAYGLIFESAGVH